MTKNSRILRNEIAFYEKRKQELSQHAKQRQQLANTARDLGALLEPSAIQEKLIQTARVLYPKRVVEITYGQSPDRVDTAVIQKKQPVLVPNEIIKGKPIMAVPILAQRSIAGILRVSGEQGGPFTREDVRLLDVLASLASLALDNSVLISQVKETALRDGLTGLLTHRAFQDGLEASILEASRYHQSLSLILMDVDHFKSINDTYGHQAGDQVLQGFAHVLVGNVRDVDLVARYGGEEFVVLLLQTSHEEAVKMAEQIRMALQDQEFEIGPKTIKITGSFGVATFPEDASTPSQLIRCADERLYAAKKGGRNQVRARAA